MSREKITFEPNIPVQTTLDKSQSKPIEGRNGQTDYMRVCDNDERIMFCPEGLEQAIQESGAKAGDVVRIIQRGTGKKTTWDVGIISEDTRHLAHVHPPAAREIAQAAASQRNASRHAANHAAELGINAADLQPAGRQISTEAAEMTSALTAAIEAARAAELYAKMAGIEGFRLQAGDVKALACTIYIQRLQAAA